MKKTIIPLILVCLLLFVACANPFGGENVNWNNLPAQSENEITDASSFEEAPSEENSFEESPSEENTEEETSVEISLMPLTKAQYEQIQPGMYQEELEEIIGDSIIQYLHVDWRRLLFKITDTGEYGRIVMVYGGVYENTRFAHMAIAEIRRYNANGDVLEIITAESYPCSPNQQQVDQLKVGMTVAEVEAILGRSVYLHDPENYITRQFFSGKRVKIQFGGEGVFPNGYTVTSIEICDTFSHDSQLTTSTE